jgi:hypothetical protein
MDVEQDKGNDPNLSRSHKKLVEHGASENCIRFGLYDEGEGVHSLYLSPIDAQTVTNALFQHSQEAQLVVSSPLAVPKDCQRISRGVWMGPAQQFLELTAPIEALVLDAPPANINELETQLPASLLGNPNAALPKHYGARFALCMLDGRHAVILSRDSQVFASALGALIVQLENAQGVAEPPHISATAMNSLLEPLEPWNWCEIEFGVHQRFQTLDIMLVNGMADGKRDTGMRWVAPKDGGWWRTGWTW